ncbi:MAG: iron-containing alcohol dehydrogenase [Flavobacterium psychrophilum]
MRNFDLYNPTKLLFGTQQIEKLANLVPNDARALLVYGGGSIFANGIHAQVIAALQGFHLVEFGGVEPNPRYETLMQAVEVIRKEQLNFILAVGGGSVIDGVKFISAATHFAGDAARILHERILFTDLSKVVPFGTVLTLPATGSEMNSGAVVTIQATQEKLTLGGSALFPKFSICDPTVIASLPKRQLQNGVIDSFMHVMEQYLTYPHEAYLQDRIAEGILQTLVEMGPKVIDNPSDYVLASNFMWCCTMALNGLLNKGVPVDWATHMIGHELTALYEIDHARTLAIIAPNLYRVLLETKQDKLIQYGERVWNISSGTPAERANQAIDKTTQFFKQLGVPTKLSQYTPDFAQTADFIVNRFKQRGWIALGERQNIDLAKLRQIVEMSY